MPLPDCFRCFFGLLLCEARGQSISYLLRGRGQVSNSLTILMSILSESSKPLCTAKSGAVQVESMPKEQLAQFILPPL